jgi:nitrous oxide reductase accessory protein NosL
MGANITAFSSKEDAEHVQHVKGGEIMDFDAVKVHAAQKVHS